MVDARDSKSRFLRRVRVRFPPSAPKNFLPKMQKFNLKSQKRGAEKVKSIRKDKKIPAVVYGPKFSGAQICVDYLEFRKIFERTHFSKLIDLEIEGKTTKVLVHEIQIEPVRDEFLHIDFYAVDEDKEIKVALPIHLKGDAPAVKNFGGILTHAKDSVEIKCLTRNLIADLSIDVSVLENLHDKITVADLPKFENVKFMADEDEVIATVIAPRAEKTETEETASETDAEKTENKDNKKEDKKEEAKN